MKISTKTKLTFSIVLLCVSAILIASIAGLIPDERKLRAATRADLCESLATSVTFLVSKREIDQATLQMEIFAQRHDDVVSTGLRYNSGELVSQTGNHQVRWQQGLSHKKDGCYVVPINARNGTWGTLELQFEPLYMGLNRYISASLLKLLALMGPLIALACYFHFSRVLKILDPNRVVPNRVRQTLDGFAEGVVLLDAEDRIVLANNSFAEYLDLPVDQLIGTKFSSLPWELSEDGLNGIVSLKNATRRDATSRATTMKLTDRNGKVTAIFSVNATAVLDDTDTYQGLMAAFADVTQLEQKREQLALTLTALQNSKQEISKQNEELRYLATRDPLTSCVNRRLFFELFDEHWEKAQTTGSPLCAVMVDIDYFKPINDTYGHGRGDEVLREVGKLLTSMARERDVVCRYGGEEFSLLMPGLTIEEAAAAAEQMRLKLAELTFPEFSITASLGVSGCDLGADDPQGMLDQADKCLYVAKRNGRNQVVRFDTVPADLLIDESEISREKPDDAAELVPILIPFPAVTALLSALSYRDSQTGQHSTRVSNYAALLAQRVLRPRDVYVVEMAALLHDIGKIGVPDSILLKPGPLTKEEWVLMDRHDRIGIEIISKSFKYPLLTDIVKYHHVRYDGAKGNENDPVGEAIPIGARILTVVDSFDAMISDRPYRKGMPVEDAICELRRCAGGQFDPVLVELFVDVIESRGSVTPLSDYESVTNELILRIGEQVERLVDAADVGDSKTFAALAERLRLTAQQSNVETLVNAASHAIEVANEDAQLEQLVEESFELLAVCRSLRSNLATTIDGR